MHNAVGTLFFAVFDYGFHCPPLFPLLMFSLTKTSSRIGRIHLAFTSEFLFFCKKEGASKFCSSVPFIALRDSFRICKMRFQPDI